jgi:hypothetical protein
MTKTVAIPDQNVWNCWSPTELAVRLTNVSRPWCIVGGWALDLWLGEQTRAHGDIEFTLLREDFPVFRSKLGDLFAYSVKDGVLTLLPTSQLPGPEIKQVWCFDPNAKAWRVDIMIEGGTQDMWVYKRECSVRFPRADMVRLSSKGIPYLRPAATLLFKARHTRPKDEIDFHRTLPTLPYEEVTWLKTHLISLHPRHEWLSHL